MWWRLILMVIVLMAAFFVGGLYAGAALFLKLTGGDIGSMSYHTLWDARKLPFTDRRLLYLPWAWCVTAALTFLPTGFVLLSIFLRLKPITSLHGDARFANESELRLFKYDGEYKDMRSPKQRKKDAKERRKQR
ncbi:hypothetical protein [Pseudomonas viridiflava]|uniref:hypothetical protein n=1 Tax=Pseudomonas viridiflava TaxID=33069 RepID=UPI000F018A22|nr:hypothetical protein [Pseudomonas viridiflava]